MNYLTLTRKGEADPTPFDDIDRELCALLAVPVHPTFWIYDWFPTVALRLLEGKTLVQIRAAVKAARPIGDPDSEEDRVLDELYRDALDRVCVYLEEHFVVNDPAFIRR